jgi:Arc/MetJ family transcription regulator
LIVFAALTSRTAPSAGRMVRVDQELSAELLERAGLDQRRAALGLEPEATNRDCVTADPL